MTAAALVQLLGGLRATVFAALALALLVATGVQSCRLDSAQADRDNWAAAAAGALEANRTNVATIASLRKANKAWADAADARTRKAAEAVATVARERDALAAEIAERRKDRGIIYRENPDAAAWGRTRVPDAIARQLRE